MATVGTVPAFGTGTANAVEPSSTPAGTLSSGAPTTAPVTSTAKSAGATTSGPLTKTVANYRFKTPGLSKKTAKAAPVAKKRGASQGFRATQESNANSAGRTVPTTAPQTDRTEQLRQIAGMKAPPTRTTKTAETKGPVGKVDSIEHDIFGGGTTTKGHVGGSIADVINTIGRHVLGQKTFTITKSNLSQKQWDEIKQQATIRLDEHEKTNATRGAASKVTDTETRGATGQELYTLFLKTYDSGTKVATGPTKGKTTAEAWNAKFVSMGVLSTYTPSPAEAQTAYKAVLKQAQQGNTTATGIIKTQITDQAKTLADMQAQVGTGATGQSLSDYYVEQFTQLAHTYLVPVSQSTINQRAALAAQEGGTYQVKDNEVSDFTETMQKQASSLYSTFATQIEKGVPTKTLLNPYAEVAAKTLGYTSNVESATSGLGITWMQPKWSVALQGGKAETGKLPGPMSLTAFRQHLITTPQYGWQNTATAQQMKLNVGQQLAQAFGLRKS